MIARKRIDISVTDALQGLLVHCWSGGNAPWLTERTRQLEQRWHTTRAPFHSGCLVTLSVRTAFDLFLRALQLPAGSVVLMSAVTIRDMGDVVAQNGFMPVPVDISPRTMAPALEDIARLFDQLERDGSRVRVVCIAHLLGTVVDMEPIVCLAHERGAVVFEDCAQAFKGSVVLARGRGGVVVWRHQNGRCGGRRHCECARRAAAGAHARTCGGAADARARQLRAASADSGGNVFFAEAAAVPPALVRAALGG
jgi:dTDP-4-amino-4,6-dideoxygalactose transaminase